MTSTGANLENKDFRHWECGKPYPEGGAGSDREVAAAVQPPQTPQLAGLPIIGIGGSIGFTSPGSRVAASTKLFGSPNIESWPEFDTCELRTGKTDGSIGDKPRKYQGQWVQRRCSGDHSIANGTQLLHPVVSKYGICSSSLEGGGHS